jgi:hypothetical protein
MKKIRLGIYYKPAISFNIFILLNRSRGLGSHNLHGVHCRIINSTRRFNIIVGLVVVRLSVDVGSIGTRDWFSAFEVNQHSCDNEKDTTHSTNHNNNDFDFIGFFFHLIGCIDA